MAAVFRSLGRKDFSASYAVGPPNDENDHIRRLVRGVPAFDLDYPTGHGFAGVMQCTAAEQGCRENEQA